MGIEGFIPAIKNASGVTEHFIGYKVPIRNFLIDFYSIIHVASFNLTKQLDQILLYLIYAEHDIMISTQSISTNLGFDLDLLKELDLSAQISAYKSHFTPELIENTIIQMIRDYIKYLLDTYTMRDKLRTVYFSSDGIPNMAKIVEQKHRKYLDYIIDGLNEKIRGVYTDKLSEKRKLFETNRIVCTKYTLSKSEGFVNRVEKAISDLDWISSLDASSEQLEWIVSGSDIPGEGEKKLMEWVVDNIGGTAKNPTLFYSPDSDIILLSMVLQNIGWTINGDPIEYYVLRYYPESQMYTLYQTNMISDWVYRQVLSESDDSPNPINMSKRYDIVNNFISICTLFGNDFLPKIPIFDIVQCIPYIFRALGQLDKTRGNFRIIDYNGKFVINYGNFLLFLEEFNTCFGYQLLSNAYTEELKKNFHLKLSSGLIKTYTNSNLIFRYEPLSRLDYELNELDKKSGSYKGKLGGLMEHKPLDSFIKSYYWDYMGLNSTGKIRKVIDEYLIGISWVIDFYFNKNNSLYNSQNVSTWFYPYDRAPLLSDIIFGLANMLANQRTDLIWKNITSNSTKRTKFFNKYEQSLYVLPVDRLRTENIIMPGYEKLLGDSQLYIGLGNYINKIWKGHNYGALIDSRGIKNLHKSIVLKIPKIRFSTWYSVLLEYKKSPGELVQDQVSNIKRAKIDIEKID